MKQKRKVLAGLLGCLMLLTACRGGGGAREEEKWVLVQEGAVTLSDGTAVDLWQTEHFSRRSDYKLPDGTVLLSEARPSGPDHVYVIGQESFDDLSRTAQEAVLAYYQEQGLLYDVADTCQRAYEDYLDCQNNDRKFFGHYLDQSIAPTASNEEIMCFITSVTLPKGGQIVQELRLGAVFHRDTGEAISAWDLFTVPEDEAFDRLMDCSGISDPALRKELRAAMRPEYIILFPDNLEISFPEGALPSQEYSYGMGIDYPELDGLLYDWAVPTPSQ